MEEEKIEAVTLDELLTDEPVEKVEAEAPKQETEAEAAERVRDEKGRFVAKESPQEETPAVESPKEEKPELHIPSWRLKEEADARREAIERASRAEQEAQAFRQQLWQLQQQLQAQQQPKPEPVDIFADPDGYKHHVAQTMDQRLKAMEGNFSLRLAAYKHGDTFHEAWSDMMNRTQMGDDSLRQQVLQSPDPGETLVQLYQREKVYSEVGNDPNAYREKLKAELLKDQTFLAEALNAARGVASAQPTQKINLPPSLNKATAAISQDDGDGSPASVWRYATR